MKEIINKGFKALVIVIAVSIAYFKGFDSGFREGMQAGQIRELVNQGYTIEDAKRITDGRKRMMTTMTELYKNKE